MISVFTKSLKSFKFAFLGIGWVLKSENNAKVHLLATILVLNAGFFFEIDKFEWLWLFLCITLVWATEIINTSIEKLVDLVSPEYNIVAGKVKDLGAAAVLVTAIFSVITASVIFVPYLLRLLENKR